MEIEGSSNNQFFRNHYAHVMMSVMGLLLFMLIAVSSLLYQTSHRPLPSFVAEQQDHNKMQLTPFTEPNLLSDALLRWASTAATLAYTFDFVNYNDQINLARPYFTDAGWVDYINSIRGLISTIVKNQLFVNGVVAGTPIISNQGDIFGRGYAWRVQIPFLVTYQTAESQTKRNYFVVLTLVKVSTAVNKYGVGIDQFVMV
jgi:intracellular multiplication protein IcmL